MCGLLVAVGNHAPLAGLGSDTGGIEQLMRFALHMTAYLAFISIALSNGVSGWTYYSLLAIFVVRDLLSFHEGQRACYGPIY